MTQFSQLFKPKSGQAGLIIISVLLLVVLIMGGASLSNMANVNSQRNVIDRRSMQTYYIAQAGLQEALATRLVPRSNFLNFVRSGAAPFNINLPAQVTPYYTNSGLVYQKPGTPSRELLGVYRYIILGGDPSRQADGSYYGAPAGPPFGAGPNVTNNTARIPRLVTFQSNPPASPFFVVSNGVTCVRGNGTAGTDQGIDQFMGTVANIQNANQLTLSNVGAPQCKAGYTAQEMTLVAQVSVEQESGAKDKVDVVRQFKDRTNLTLPGSSFVPGRGWVTSGTAINFDSAWGSQSNVAGLTPGRPMQMVFFKFGTNQIYQVVNLSGGGNVIAPNPVPADASMMLYFDGPIDYRSISSIDWTGNASQLYNKDLNGCKVGASYSCGIRLYENSPGFPLYTGLKVVPIMPYLTKVLLLAPLGNNINSGKSYHMDITGGQFAGGQYRSFSYAAGTRVVLNFITQ